MNNTSFLGLLQNAALLMALVLVFDSFGARFRRSPALFYRVLSGLIIGGVGIVVMRTPWAASPGVFFDARSVLLSLTGLYLGLIPTLITVFITAAYRLYIGGGGVLSGVLTVLLTGALGLGWRYLRRRPLDQAGWLELYGFGMVVHLALLALFYFALPRSSVYQLLQAVTLPVLFIYPLTSAFLGKWMSYRLQHELLQEELRLSEARLNTTQRLTRAGGWEFNLQNQMLYWSAEVYRLYGQEPQSLHSEFCGNITEELRGFDPPEREIVAEAYQRCAENGVPYEIELPFTNDRGERLWMRVHGEPVWEAGKIVRVAGVLQDVTARKQAELARQESEAKYRLLVENAGEAITMLAENGQFLLMNNAAARFLGGQPQDFLGKTLRDAIEPAEAEQILATIQEVVATGQPDTREIPVWLQGEPRWFRVSMQPIRDGTGKIIAVMSLNADLTERRRAEEALRESEERYQLIDAASQDLIYSYDLQGRFTHASLSLCRLLGLERDQIVGKTHAELGFPPEQCEEWDRLHQQVRATNATVIAETLTPIQDGTPQYFEVVLNPIHGEAGEVIGVAGVTRDINARKRAEAQINAQLDELRRWQNITLGREARIMELKSEINQLLIEAGQPPRYRSVLEESETGAVD